MKRVVFTGSTGFIGRHLKTEILKYFPNCEIIEITHDIIDLRESMMGYIIKDKNSIDYFFHLASYSPAGNKNNSEIFINNNFINMNVLNYWKNYLYNSKFITFGTSASYNDNDTNIINYFKSTPNENDSAYVLSKRILIDGLKILSSENKNLKWNYFIPSTVFGEQFDENDHHLIPDIVRKIYNGQKIFNAQKVFRNYIYIKDACKIILDLSQKKTNNMINLCSNENITIYDLIKKISLLSDKNDIIINDIKNEKLNDRKMFFKEKYDFEPLENSLKKIINWYRINN